MRYRLLVVTFLAAALSAGGCASAFHEHHYFKSQVARTGEPINYYRVSVDGSVLLSSSRYISGYFSDDAINSYFGDYKQPPDAHFGSSPNPSSGTSDTVAASGASASANKSAEIVEPVASRAERRLVLLLSSNSDAIADGLSSLAKSSEVTTALTNLVGAKRFEASEKAQAAGVQADDGAKVLIEKGKTMLATLTAADAPDVKTTSTILLNYANDLAHFLGSNVEFATLEEADRWLAANSTTFGGGAQ